MSTPAAAGIDLGGTQIKAVVVDAAGVVLQRELRETGESGAWVETICALVEKLAHHLPVGISAPGLAAADARAIRFMPARLHGIEGLDWTELLGGARRVPVINDGQASLTGEAWIGNARDCQNAILLTLGTGVGGAILSDGRVLRGHLGRAGHLGHVCLDVHGSPDIVGTPGSLEDMIGNHNIAARTGGRFATTHALLQACREGDADAQVAWGKSVQALACAIASLINILDPEAVILGGGIAQAGDALFVPLEKALAQIEWQPGGKRVRLLPAALGEWAGAIGAARVAMLEEPT